MKIKIQIDYHTEWGESLYIGGTLPVLGASNLEKAAIMEMTAPDIWAIAFEVPDDVRSFEYTFVVKSEGKPWRLEWGAPHRFEAGDGIAEYDIHSLWQDMPSDKPYYSSAFVDGMLSRNFRDQPLKPRPGCTLFRVLAPMVSPDEVLAVSGECKMLGNWQPEQALVFNDAYYPLWEVQLDMSDVTLPLEYKFLILDKKTRKVKEWEARDNRHLDFFPAGRDSILVLDGVRFENPRRSWKGAGTAIPVFSLRSTEDGGVGDFHDLKKMVDWCVKTGQKILQLLPVNDTTKTGTWTDSYPYSANSTFALHPMYVHLKAVGTIKDKERRHHYIEEAERLNALPQVDYEAVNAMKNSYMREIYAEQGEKTRQTDSYKAFAESNEYWLRSYAAWSILRDFFHTADCGGWGEYAVYDEKKVDRFIKEHEYDFGYYYFVQYHLDRQLREVRDYAHQHGIVLKGDIPIGVGRESVDAWKDPQLFNMDSQAGAPPDDFSVLGQNWGFPTYNWDEMARDGFAWWKNRFRKMAEYFDAYRIDHILGFFRIWQIPMDAVHGLLGYFNPALPYSPEELRRNYDFWIHPELQCRPFIQEWMLTDFFGEYTGEVKEEYLEASGNGGYRLKEHVDTQRKVEDHFSRLAPDEKNTRIKNALLGLIDDVLFIEDPYQKGHYHPRISAQFTYQFRNLTDYERWCFNRLYNDFFYHRMNDFWYGKAMWKLPPLLDSTGMLTCAEDLGMIPDCVPEVMRRLQILSLEIQRMPKDPKTEFGDTWHYPYYSVCTTSTHDMDGIRAWWEQNPAASQRYFNYVLNEQGKAPFYAEPWICSKIVDLHLKSPSMLCILPLQDWLSTSSELRRENPHDELINVPANPRHYWRYRMHLPIERLIESDSFNTGLSAWISESGR
ncbi:MAG: 4-alpha-glucanotransferase [Muribaculaceae bacterium]|nr:4-alpha-glucanotransferase [Muribaculaceae bacterium]